MALMFVFVSCLVANSIIIANSCQLGISRTENFDLHKFAGEWHELYEVSALEPYMHHFEHYVAETDDGTGNFIVTTKLVSNGQERMYQGLATDVKTSGKFMYTNKDLEGLSGPYEILDTDYDCYGILHGCPKAAPVKDLLWIQYRSKKPTPECEAAAMNSINKIGIQPTFMARDEYKR